MVVTKGFFSPGKGREIGRMGLQPYDQLALCLVAVGHKPAALIRPPQDPQALWMGLERLGLAGEHTDENYVAVARSAEDANRLRELHLRLLSDPSDREIGYALGSALGYPEQALLSYRSGNIWDAYIDGLVGRWAEGHKILRRSAYLMHVPATNVRNGKISWADGRYAEKAMQLAAWFVPEAGRHIEQMFFAEVQERYERIFGTREPQTLCDACMNAVRP